MIGVGRCFTSEDRTWLWTDSPEGIISAREPAFERESVENIEVLAACYVLPHGLESAESVHMVMNPR